MPTIDEALAYLGIDYTDTVVLANVQRALAAAGQTLRGAVGADVDKLMGDDPRVKELVLVFMDDLYSQRGLSAKVTGATRRMVADMVLQLQLELRTLREEAGA